MRLKQLAKRPILEGDLHFGDLFCSAFSLDLVSLYFYIGNRKAISCFFLVSKTDDTYNDPYALSTDTDDLIEKKVPNNVYCLDIRANVTALEEKYPLEGFLPQENSIVKSLTSPRYVWLLLESFSVEELLVCEEKWFRETAKKFVTSQKFPLI